MIEVTMSRLLFSAKMVLLMMLAIPLAVCAWMPDTFHDLLKKNDFSNAYKIARALAMTGNAEAKYWSAYLVLGDTVAGDKVKAKELLLESANANFLESQWYLASSYRSGDRNFPKDLEKAIHWFKKTFDNGSKSAASDLGFLYYSIGNTQAAKHWLKISAINGDNFSSKMLNAMEDEESRQKRWIRPPIICDQLGSSIVCN